jgi:hypothetical protein
VSKQVVCAANVGLDKGDPGAGDLLSPGNHRRVAVVEVVI